MPQILSCPVGLIGNRFSLLAPALTVIFTFLLCSCSSSGENAGSYIAVSVSNGTENRFDDNIHCTYLPALNTVEIVAIGEDMTQITISVRGLEAREYAVSAVYTHWDAKIDYTFSNKNYRARSGTLTVTRAGGPGSLFEGFFDTIAISGGGGPHYDPLKGRFSVRRDH